MRLTRHASYSRTRSFSATVGFRWLAAGDTGDFDAFDELLHRDVIVHPPLGLSSATVHGEKAVWRDALAAYAEPPPRLQ